MIKPLSKTIFEKAVSLNIAKINLHFSGGSDEGYLDVDFSYKDKGEYTNQWEFWEKGLSSDQKQEIYTFQSEIEEWAWDTFHYGGAGDGSDYGDDITYDLVEKTVEHSEWYTARVDGDASEMELEVE